MNRPESEPVRERWISAVSSVLANDETSTDAELIAYFVENGMDETEARELVAGRVAHWGNL